MNNNLRPLMNFIRLKQPSMTGGCPRCRITLLESVRALLSAAHTFFMPVPIVSLALFFCIAAPGTAAAPSDCRGAHLMETIDETHTRPYACGSDLVRVVAGTLVGAMPGAGQAATQGNRGATEEKNRLTDRLRTIGDLLVAGEDGRARDIVRAIDRQCRAGEADVQDCAQWEQLIRGLNLLLAEPGKQKVITNSIGMKMVRIPTKEYMMGSLRQEMDWVRLTFRKIWREGHKQWFHDEMPVHPVRITEPFFMSATEVTVGQFREFVKDTKYKTDAEKGDGGMIFSTQENRWVPQEDMAWDSTPWPIADDQPVVFVSWNDAKEFCRWLGRKEKRTYRLPREAEWEMACRGGSAWARYPWGNRLPGGRDTNFGDGHPKLPESLTTVDDGYKYVSPVASYPPNGFGLYDMAGNVMEWVEDRYGRNYYETSPLEDPVGPDVGAARVNKGGNFYASPADGRCAFRGFSGPEMSFWNLGFRVVMEEAPDFKEVLAAKSDETTSSKESDSTFPPTEEEALGLFRRAMFSAQQQQWDEAVQDLEEALGIYEKRRDYRWIARVKATLAGIYAERERTYKSKELFRQALAEFRRIGDLDSARVILARLVELEKHPGVKVVEVKKGGAGDLAGIMEEDIIIEYAGETGFKVGSFTQLVNDYARLDKVTITVLNNDEITTLVVPGGPLGIAIEDIRRLPRPSRAVDSDQRREQSRDERRRGRGGSRGSRNR